MLPSQHKRKYSSVTKLALLTQNPMTPYTFQLIHQHSCYPASHVPGGVSHLRLAKVLARIYSGDRQERDCIDPAACLPRAVASACLQTWGKATSSLVFWKFRQDFEAEVSFCSQTKQEPVHPRAPQSWDGDLPRPSPIRRGRQGDFHSPVFSAKRVAVSQHQRWYLGTQKRDGCL